MAPERPHADAEPGGSEPLDRRSFLSGAASAAVATAVSGAGLTAAAGPAGAGALATAVPALAQVSVPAGALSVQQRQGMVAGVTRVLAGVTGAGPAGLPYLTVLVSEVPDGGWGVAGHGCVRSEFPALVAGRPLPPDATPDGMR